jgi:hypothetical protein
MVFNIDIGLLLFLTHLTLTVVALTVDLVLQTNGYETISDVARKHALVATVILLHLQLPPLFLTIHLYM